MRKSNRTFIFEFTFAFEDGFDDEAWTIPILEEPDHMEDLMQACEDDEVAWDEMMYDLETTYGVHDASWGDDNIAGFTSYEVKHDKVPELMARWKGIIESYGYVCGEPSCGPR